MPRTASVEYNAASQLTKNAGKLPKRQEHFTDLKITDREEHAFIEKHDSGILPFVKSSEKFSPMAQESIW